jgi:hypothetical protein
VSTTRRNSKTGTRNFTDQGNPSHEGTRDRRVSDCCPPLQPANGHERDLVPKGNHRPALPLLGEAFASRRDHDDDYAIIRCHRRACPTRSGHGTATPGGSGVTKLQCCSWTTPSLLIIVYQRRLVRFVENHDEPRAASAFGATRSQVAAVATVTQCGARLIHNRQLEGPTVHLLVFLGRYPIEPPDHALLTFYRSLLPALADPTFRHGRWRLCGRHGSRRCTRPGSRSSPGSEQRRRSDRSFD